MGAQDAPEAQKQQSTVNEMLALPAPASPLRRVAYVLCLIGALAWLTTALAGICDAFIANESPWYEIIRPLVEEALPLVALSGTTVVALGVGLLVFSVAARKPRYDKKAFTKRAVCSLLLSLPRFGVKGETPLKEVGLRVRPVVGIKDAAIFSVRGNFSRDDLKGRRPSEFGAYDFEVIDGAIYVFYSQEAKEKFVARLNKKVMK